MISRLADAFVDTAKGGLSPFMPAGGYLSLPANESLNTPYRKMFPTFNTLCCLLSRQQCPFR